MKAPETVQCKNCLFRGLFIFAVDEPGSRAKSQPKDGLGLDILATAANCAFRQNMIQGKRDCFLPVVFYILQKRFFRTIIKRMAWKWYQKHMRKQGKYGYGEYTGAQRQE